AHPMPGASRTPPLQATSSWDASSVPSPCPITVRVNGRDLNGAPATQSPKPKYVLLVLFDMRGFILHDGQAFHPSLTLKIVTHWFIALTGRNAMRLILATATVALAISAATSTAVFAQKKNTDEAKASRAQAR